MILLDTHVALWVANEPERIGARSRHLLETSSVVALSAVSAIEITFKRMIGRLAVPADVVDRLVRDGLVELPVTSRHATGLEELPELAGHDPFDRLLMAQALVERATFLSADRRLLGLGYSWVVDVRA